VVESDLVGDVRGGDSFSDIYGLKRYAISFLMVWSVVLVKGTIVQFPQTYGPYNSLIARVVAKFILRRSSVIIARDKESQRVAQELAGSAHDVLLSPDVAFSLKSVRPERIEIDPPFDGAMPLDVIGLNINGLMYNGGYTRRNMFGLKMDYVVFLQKLVGTLLAEFAGELWLVPHTFAPHGNVESDNEASEKLRNDLPPELRRRVRIVTGDYDPHELKGIIGQFDFFVGSRMHSCIAALSQGVPCVGVAYSRKFVGVFETVGMVEWVVDARSTHQDEAVTRIVDLYQQRNEVRAPLMQMADQARRDLIELFRNLVVNNSPISQ
jgi:polysaccharide pyruvyl transferase WcaK-like protein